MELLIARVLTSTGLILAWTTSWIYRKLRPDQPVPPRAARLGTFCKTVLPKRVNCQPTEHGQVKIAPVRTIGTIAKTRERTIGVIDRTREPTIGVIARNSETICRIIAPIASTTWTADELIVKNVATRYAISSGTTTPVPTFGEIIPTRRGGDGIVPIAGPLGLRSPIGSRGVGVSLRATVTVTPFITRATRSTMATIRPPVPTSMPNRPRALQRTLRKLPMIQNGCRSVYSH